MYLGKKYSGRSLKEITKHLGIGESGVSQKCRRVVERLTKGKECFHRGKIRDLNRNFLVSITTKLPERRFS